MKTPEDVLKRIAGETKALMLIHEYRTGNLVLPELRMMLAVLAPTDLERVGILELIRRKLPESGLEEEQCRLLMQGLGGQEAAETVSFTLHTPPKITRGHTVRLHSFDAPGAPATPAPNPNPGTAPEGQKTVQIQVRRPAGNTTVEVPKPSIAETMPQKESVASFVPPAAPKRKNWRVLMADDDSRIRMVFRKMLVERGIILEDVADGDEAWKRLQRDTFDILIMDMKMPGLHGLELLERLTTSGINIPVVVCSAYDQLKSEFVVSTYKKLRYLVKPVPIDKLMQAMEELMESSAEAGC